MTTKIVLGVDGRPASDNATRWAIARATRPDVTLRIVSVATDDSFLHDVADKAVARAVKMVTTAAPRACVTGDVIEGNVFDSLLRESESADLLVVGSDRPNSLIAALLGSLPMHLSGRVNCDLAIVPLGWSASTEAKVVTVGWDDDRVGFEAIEIAVDEARATDSTVRIVHVWTPPVTSPYELASADYLDALERAAESLLLDATEQARRRHPGITFTSELHLGPVAGGLLSHHSDIDLLVVGSHRRTALGEVIFGSTGDALIRASDSVPILIARKSDRLVPTSNAD